MKRALVVMEMLVPVVDALEKYGNDKIVFIPTFHSKDPNAPFVVNRDKTYTAKRSEVYDLVLDRLDGKVRMIREPKAREALPNSQDRIAMADFIVMNSLSIETWTATFCFRPMVFVLTPKVIEEC